ncbi:MAG: membrane protein insertase YidC [Planctomycetes bacterium]|nr:membrane protein insertase YidC [Planctomycetota bacterium]
MEPDNQLLTAPSSTGNRPMIGWVLICGLVWIWMNIFFSPPKPVAKPTTPAGAPTDPAAPADGKGPAAVPPANGGNGAPPIAPPVPAPANGAAPAAPAWVEPPPADLLLANDHVRVTLTNRGAGVKSVELLNYKGIDFKFPHRLLAEFETGHPAFTLRDLDGKAPLDKVRWAAEPTQPGTVTYRYEAPTGAIYQKIFRLRPSAKPEDRHLLSLTVVVSSRAPGPLPQRLEIEAAAGVDVETEPNRTDLIGHLGASTDGQRWRLIEATHPSDVAEKEKTVATDKAGWIAISSKFFAHVLVPETASEFTEFVFRVQAETALYDKAWKELAKGAPPGANEPAEVEARKRSRANLACALRFKPFELRPDEIRTFKLSSYNGPKSDEDLSAHIGLGLPFLLDFGWWGIISRFLLGILGFLHGLCGNYGWSIILLTFLVRACLFPLTRKSQISMFRMQKLQPEFASLKAKYGDDKQKFNVEVMKLYQENGVNPLGGCLPIFFQIPVFIGLYNALNYCIDLRQQPWLAWVTDLSAPDRLIHFSGTVFGQDSLHLLPLVMTATWFVQSWLQPKSPDPDQQQMQRTMQFMPVMFGLMMYNMPAGLIIYWMTSTCLGIAEQQYIKKVLLPKLG